MIKEQTTPTDFQLKELSKIYIQELKDNPKDLVLRLKLAEVFCLLKRIDGAINLYHSVAFSYAKGGNLGQSIMICKKILDIRPDHSNTLEMLAKLCKSKQTRDEKRNIPVQNIGGKWIADPLGGNRSSASNLKSEPRNEAISFQPTMLAPDDDSAPHPRPITVPAIPSRKLTSANVNRPASPPTPQETLPPVLAPIHDSGVYIPPEEERSDIRSIHSKRLAKTILDPTIVEYVEELEDGDLDETPSPSSLQSPPSQPYFTQQDHVVTQEDQKRVPVEAKPPRPTNPMDSALLNSLLRMDAEYAYQDPPETKGFGAIEKEVHLAGLTLEPATDFPEQANPDPITPPDDPPLEPEEFSEELQIPFPLFSALEPAAFMALIKKMERRFYSAGSFLFKEGDPGDSLFLVASGMLQVIKDDENDKQIQLARLGGGSFLGEFGLLTDGHRHAAVRCVEECELLELKRDVLLDLAKEYPSIPWTLRMFYQQRIMTMVMATSPLFKAVSQLERKAVLSQFTFRRFLGREVVIHQGKTGPGFFVILVGEAAVYLRPEEDQEEILIGILSEGEYFGEMSLLTGRSATATVMAEGVMEVLMLDSSDFYDLAARHPEIWNEVQKESERRRMEINELAGTPLKSIKKNEICLI